MALLVYSYDFLTLTQATLNQVGQNFADVATLLNGNIRAVNIHDNAGIRASQLAAKFSTYHVEKTLLPVNANGTMDIGAVQYISSQQYDSNIYRVKTKIRTKNGQLKLLCAIDVYVLQEAVEDFAIEVLRNGSQVVAGSLFTIPAGLDTFYEIANDNPLDNPFAAFANLDILEYRFGYASATGSEVRGVHVTEHWKSELTT